MVEIIKSKLHELGTTKYTFKDDNGKLSPISICGIEIYGVYISPSGTVWLVDGTYVRSDMFNNIEPWYYGDKHLASSFNKNCLSKIIEILQ